MGSPIHNEINLISVKWPFDIKFRGNKKITWNLFPSHFSSKRYRNFITKLSIHVKEKRINIRLTSSLSRRSLVKLIQVFQSSNNFLVAIQEIQQFTLYFLPKTGFLLKSPFILSQQSLFAYQFCFSVGAPLRNSSPTSINVFDIHKWHNKS